MAESKSVTVVPLTGVNYATWKIQCQMALMKDGLWNMVNGTETAPAGGEALVKFISRKDLTLAIIVLSVDPTLLYLLGEPTDPVDVWKALSDQFQKKTWTNRLNLRRRLHSLKLKDGDSVQSHIKEMTEVFNELAVVGENIGDDDRVVYLLASLPESYNMLVTALEANETVLGMKTVVERLIHEEKKLQDRATPSNSASGRVWLRDISKRKAQDVTFIRNSDTSNVIATTNFRRLQMRSIQLTARDHRTKLIVQRHDTLTVLILLIRIVMEQVW
jgi:hypothetical protein